jgi:hypothetical protein
MTIETFVNNLAEFVLCARDRERNLRDRWREEGTKSGKREAREAQLKADMWEALLVMINHAVLEDKP